MILDTTGEYPVVNGYRIRYVVIMRDGEYGCNDTVYDWDGWDKDKNRAVIVELLTAAARCRYTKFGQCGGSFERLHSGRTEIVHFGFYEKICAGLGA